MLLISKAKTRLNVMPINQITNQATVVCFSLIDFMVVRFVQF